MAKKILVVDDSALMRRVICDIIDNDERFQVADKATNGLEALELLKKNQYDAVVLDVNMPKMSGLQLLEELRKLKIPAKVMMNSTDTREGAKTTMEALELGALDFVHKPDSAVDCHVESFKNKLLQTLEVVANSKPAMFAPTTRIQDSKQTAEMMADLARKFSGKIKGSKIVAIACSTGGPKALQSVIPRLPGDLNAPVLLVQHMPKGFTASLAERLNELSQVTVKEAQEGDELVKGTVYLSMGGLHMNVRNNGGRYTIHYSDEPSREGVKPCANYMFESLSDSQFDEVVCVVMTGMGADGTEGIKNLESKKKVHVIAQDQNSCVVYGMPKSVINAGLSDQVVPLDQLAQEIALNVGIKV